ncbi:ATP:ADP Antiporter (AAA) Family [Trachipleistophora hominis]|uniref:ADP,ATP carrier protein n=1 Tax=Trachipleistophora hominis TaxID=72359 RepID=L7JXU1_TRAHO|nr:ATP:ADP Antiporter (AAA) Family [Trachipleistophora hominis]
MNVRDSEANNPNLPSAEEIEQIASTRYTGLCSIYKVAPAEDRKLMCISGMFFLIVYIYSVSKDLKDAFVIGRQVAASISVLKVFWVPPIATCFSLLVQKMSVRMKNETILKTFLYAYATYFVVYAAFMLPLREYIEPSKFITIDLLSDDKMKYKDFLAFAASIMTFTSCTGTLHFVASEVWGTIVLSLLFMQLFNEVCPEKQFKRFVPIVYALSNVGLLMSAATSYIVHYLTSRMEYDQRVYFYMAVFLLLGAGTVALILIQRYLINCVIPVQICRDTATKHKVRSKEHVGFVEGLKLVFSTNVIVALCTMVLGYNVIIIMNESAYKSCQSEVAKREKKSTESSVLANKCFEEMVTAVLVMMFFVLPTRDAIKWIGWTKYALVTPIGAFVACVAVLGLAMVATGLAGENLSPVNTFMSRLSASPEELTGKVMRWEQFFGILSTAGMKVLKYVAFDISKEYFAKRIDIAYRARFRAVYDGICARMGKAVGSILQLIFNQIFNTLDIRRSSFPYLVLALVILCIWILSVVYLGKKYNKSVERDEWVDMNFKAKDK